MFSEFCRLQIVKFGDHLSKYKTTLREFLTLLFISSLNTRPQGERSAEWIHGTFCPQCLVYQQYQCTSTVGTSVPTFMRKKISECFT